MVHGVVARSARWRMGTGIAGGADAHIPGGMDDLAVSGGALPACYHAAPNGAYSQKDQGSPRPAQSARSEEHTSELQSLMRISYAVFCLNKKKHTTIHQLISSVTSSHTQSYYTHTYQ